MRRLLTLVILAAACGKPGAAPGLDQYTCDGGLCSAPGVIEGSLVYAGPARGDAILLLFDTAALPPPQGNGSSAAAVARIPASVLFANATPGSVGPFSAPFTFTQVPSGRSYQIQAFLDVTGEFDPFFDFTQQPRAGAPAGGHGAIGADGQAHPVSIDVPAAQVVSGVNVALTLTVPFDPPSFTIAGGSPTLDASMDQPARLRLQTAQLTAKNATFASPHFGMEYDLDAAGNRQHTFADGLDDVFPRVFLRQLRKADGTAVAAADAAIVPCQALSTPVLPQLQSASAPLARDTLDVLVQPLALKQDLTPLPGIPAGAYQVIVVEKTGQVWTLPNQLGDPARAGTPYYAESQAQFVTFAPSQRPTGAISGNVVFHGDPSIVSGNIIVQAYLDSPFAPPPPLGATPPVRIALVQAAQVTKTSDGFTAPYTIAGLAPGNYIVQALDDVDGNFAGLNLLQTPTKGDLVGAVIDTSTLRPASIAVGAGTASAQDVTLAQQIALDPPQFAFASAPVLPADAVAPLRFDVVAKPLAFPAGAASAPAFTVSLVRDAAGATVDADGDGLPDVWPRAFLVRLDSSDPAGLTQAQNPDQPGQAVTQVIPAAVDPTPFMPALLAGGTLVRTQITIVARPALVDASDPTQPPHKLAHLVPGKYKLVLINQTGQIWQVPNEAGSAALDPASAALVDTASQSQVFSVSVPASLSTGSISGTLTVNGAITGAYVFAYDSSNPPPPAGTGAPVSGDYHSALEFQNNAVQYTLPNLPATKSYIVTAVADTRGDFALSPQLFAAAPGEGTLAGKFAGLVTLSSAAPQATGIDVTAAASLPARPSFTIASGVTFKDAVTPERLALHATQVLTAASAVSPEAHAPSFLVSYRGCDANGAPVDSDFDNLPDLYPRVLVVKLGATGIEPDPAGIVIPAAIDPTRFTLGACSAGTVVPASDLSVILSPVAVNASLQAMPIPAGRYGVVVMQSTGQTWRLPNELSLLDPAAAELVPSLASQGAVITVASQVPEQTTASISGSVSLGGYTPATVGNIIVAAYDATEPPPPLGTGRPKAVTLIPRALAAAFAGGAVGYQLTNLDVNPSTHYLVAALMDPLGKLSTSLDFMGSPPQGAQVSFFGGAIPSPISAAGGATGKDIALLASQQAIPFERPAFALGSGTYAFSAAAGGSVDVALAPGTPAGMPYTVAAFPYGGGTFHPTAASTTKVGGCYPSSNVVITALDTAGAAPTVTVDPCQFCPSLTGTADCSGALLAQPIPMSTPIHATISAAAGAAAAGHYAVTLIEPTGQSWTTPNDLRFTDVEQGAVFTVVP